MMTVVKGACPHDCPDTCALEVHVKDGVATKVLGAAAHAPTAGVLCTKVARYTERTYHPDRLLHPMRRRAGVIWIAKYYCNATLRSRPEISVI